MGDKGYINLLASEARGTRNVFVLTGKMTNNPEFAQKTTKNGQNWVIFENYITWHICLHFYVFTKVVPPA